MATSFSFPEMSPAEIAAALHTFGIAPTANLRAEDIANPQPELLPSVLSLFLTEIAGHESDHQLGFDLLQALDNPEHHMCAITLRRLYQKARDFLDSIYFGGITLRDLLRPHPRRVVDILSAIVNFLHFRNEKLAFLDSIINEYPGWDERLTDLKSRIAEHEKKKADHACKEQMQQPVVQQLEAEVNALKQKIQEYNTQQLALRSRAKAIDEKKEGILAKSTLEEKKGFRDELKALEKMAMHKVQDKTNTFEMYTKACEKISKHFSKISALHEISTAAKASEKEAKANRAKISDQSLEIETLRLKAAEWQSKVQETEGRLKAKEKERDRRIGENKRKITTLKSEVESELKCLADKEREIKEKIDKSVDLCSQADSVEQAGRKKREEIFATFAQICETANLYVDGMERSMREVDEASMAITKS
nr:unnamed protein product [Digitaria exilis]